MAKSKSFPHRIRGLGRRANQDRRTRLLRQRSLRLEVLENRALLTAYTYSYGAMPDDTAEYMLGDVAVNVVLLESDANIAPNDNGSLTLPDPTHPGQTYTYNYTPENWTPDAIAAAKVNVSAGLQFWNDTLTHEFPNAPSNLLNFHVNWQYADAPVNTGYEPIARPSNDFSSSSTGAGQGWIYDFLHQVHFDATGSFTKDIRSFNDSTRQQAQTDWAFTIFVVNNANDSDKLFAPGGTYTQAFSFAGGQFMVVPASRPFQTWAHETGHQFWALDEYFSGGTYTSQRGYYNTQNLNAADNPTPGFVQADSIMSNGTQMSNSYNGKKLDPYTMAAVGWQDSDHDGIFDVLDVPFSLSGYGGYNATTGNYEFSGSTHVNTLPNRNSSGTQDDIQIDQIDSVEASIDGGLWQTVATFPPRTYQAVFDGSTGNLPIIKIHLGSGSHHLEIRSADSKLRTAAAPDGVISNIFAGDTDGPTQDSGIGVSGVVFLDSNANGGLDAGEVLEPDVGLEVTDNQDVPIDLAHLVEPSDPAYVDGQILDSVDQNATLSAIGASKGTGDVYARTSTIAPSAGRVFTGTDILQHPQLTWNTSRQLRVDFTSPVSTASLRAYGSTASAASFGRLEAYTADGTLVARFTTGALSSGGFTKMTVSRAQGDIDHVIAYGYSGTNVVLDTLQWGPAASSTTNNHGAYALDYLPDGAYHIHLSPPAGYFVTTPPQGYATISVSGGRTTGSVNFGIAANSTPYHPFQNAANHFNVDNDPNNIVSPIDALTVINYLNSHLGEGEISTAQDPHVVGYVDVNGDNFCVPADALDVINYINAHLGGGEGEGLPAAGGGSSAGNGGGEGEGDSPLHQVQVPQNAAEYYAQNPIHFLNIAGADQPCSCAACVAARSDAGGQSAGGQAAGVLPLVTSGPASALTGNLDFIGEFTASGGVAKANQSTVASQPTLAIFSRPAQHSAGVALAGRKPAIDLVERLTSKLEQTLDDIAADISQAELTDGIG